MATPRYYRVTRVDKKGTAIRTNIYCSSDGVGPHTTPLIKSETITEMDAHAFYRTHDGYEIAGAA